MLIHKACMELIVTMIVCFGDSLVIISYHNIEVLSIHLKCNRRLLLQRHFDTWSFNFPQPYISPLKLKTSLYLWINSLKGRKRFYVGNHKI